MDVDIDFPTTFDPLQYFDNAISASRIDKQKNVLVKHPVGVYFQNISKDKLTDLAAIPYEQAEDLGYFKIDFLHLSLLDHFTDKQQVRELSKLDPDWSLLLSAQIVSKLFQIHRHYDLISKIQPKSIHELADCIALIRPSKRPLINKYVNLSAEQRKDFRKILYASSQDGKYHFKRSHAIAYATTIVLQLHLIKGGII